MEIANAFTVDVEDYYHVSAFETRVSRSHWHEYESRVVTNTHRVLRLLRNHESPATFFILGWVARRFPDLVRDIDRDGHEIGSHGFWHRLIYDQSPDDFRKDVRASRDVLQDILGKPVAAYRAPSFSITRRSLWALDILAEEGFRYDSSVFPIMHDRYGIPNARPDVYQIETRVGSLCEFPPTVTRIGRFHLPIGGGGYLRLYPLGLTFSCLTTINDRLHRPFMIYIHPWELDPDQPRIHNISRISRFRHYVNLASTERKVNSLLGSFQFQLLSDIAQGIRQATGNHRQEAPLVD